MIIEDNYQQPDSDSLQIESVGVLITAHQTLAYYQEPFIKG